MRTHLPVLLAMLVAGFLVGASLALDAYLVEPVEGVLRIDD